VKSVNEALTLASIVEKETGLPAERSKVAAVFSNRLKKGMRLQSDPTIVYGIVGGKGKLDRPLTRQDIATRTPYNTYRIDGLPPGPIANPGKAALQAVLNPAVTGDLYFVADGTGGHVFAETLADHKKNVAKWRAIERQRNASEADFVDELAAEKAGENAPPPAAETQQLSTAQPAKPAEQQIPAPPLPEGTAVTETTGSTAGAGGQKVVTPELPVVEDQPAEANKTADAGDSEAADQKTPPPAEAAKPATAQPVQPKPDAKSEAAAEPPPPKAEEKSQAAVEPPPKTQEKSAATAAASSAKKTEEAAAAAATESLPVPRVKPHQPLKPGDVVKIADRLVPIPIPKPMIH